MRKMKRIPEAQRKPYVAMLLGLDKMWIRKMGEERHFRDHSVNKKYTVKYQVSLLTKVQDITV